MHTDLLIHSHPINATSAFHAFVMIDRRIAQQKKHNSLRNNWRPNIKSIELLNAAFHHAIIVKTENRVPNAKYGHVYNEIISNLNHRPSNELIKCVIHLSISVFGHSTLSTQIYCNDRSICLFCYHSSLCVSVD